MKKMKVIILQCLKKLISYLELTQIVESNDLENDLPLKSLAPKNISKQTELQKIEPYLKSLTKALKSEDINNIAITGAYGSGKSTVLKTFQRQNEKKFEFLNVSLASFTQRSRPSEDTELERNLEISILQQIFYHVEPSKIPNSRFKRIANFPWRKSFTPIIFIIVWLSATFILFKFQIFLGLNPKTWSLEESFDLTLLFCFSIFLLGIAVFIKELFPILSNSKLNKVNLQGEIEIGSSTDKSIFNQHFEEILYFFEMTDFNVVVFEDIDRFDSTQIFTKLREINILINNSNSIKRSVKFIYAVKDELFNNNHRVKFFEYIIPIIPFINPNNAGDQLTQLINDSKIGNTLSPEFTSDLVTFIDDIDMRLLINIFNEYQTYREVLTSEINQDRLFAMIVYKNLDPEDFGKLGNRKGKLFDFFAQKTKITKELNTTLLKEIEEINTRIDTLGNEIEKGIKELRAVYINKLISKLTNFKNFNFDEKEVSLEGALENLYFERIKNEQNFSYYSYNEINSNRYNITTLSSQINFKEIETEVSTKYSYDEREYNLPIHYDKNLTLLKSQKSILEQKIKENSFKTMEELFEFLPSNELLESFNNNNLMRNLLINGYINESYGDYITLFHEGGITKNDFTFETKLKSGQSLPFEFELNKIENLVKRISDRYFKRTEILNYSILDFLLKYQKNNSIKLENFFSILSKDEKVQYEFIQGYLKSDLKSKNQFINLLVKSKPTVWKYFNEIAKLPYDELSELVIYIFNYASFESILQLESLSTLASFISDLPNFISFTLRLEIKDNIKDFIVNKGLKIKNLDLPNQQSSELFDFLYANNLYQINSDNIKIILTHTNQQFDLDNYNNAKYSEIYNSNQTNLQKYIKENLNYFVKNILLTDDNNTKENELALIEILNFQDLENTSKEKLLRKQDNLISDLSSIKDENSKSFVLKYHKTLVTWPNVINYYESLPTYSINDLLINYLNNTEISKSLSISEFPEYDDEDELIENFCFEIYNNNDFDDLAYENLIKKLPQIITSGFDFNLLNISKSILLINSNKVELSEANLASIGPQNRTLKKILFEIKQNELIQKISTLNLSFEDYKIILQSSSIYSFTRCRVLETLTLEDIENHLELPALVYELLFTNDLISFNKGVLFFLINKTTDSNYKLNLLYIHFDSLENDEIKLILKEMGGTYEKIFLLKKKPRFPNNEIHNSIFKKLKKRNMISSYFETYSSKHIVVVAKYS